MDYFSPGFREIRRLVERANERVRLHLAQRNLVKAETQLGLLGWQAADFDGATQRQVEALQNVEREQATLTNRTAELSRRLETIAAQRAKARLDFDQQHAALEADVAKAREPLADVERKMQVVRHNLPDVDRRVAQLNKEEREADALYTKLLSVQPQTQEVSDEIVRHRDRLLAIPNERDDLKLRHARGTAELQTHERTAATISARVGELDAQMREARKAFEAADGVLAKELREAEREKARANHETDRLDRAKRDPYLEIGRVLADSGVAPVNQPEALVRVQEFRYEISSRETAIVDSLERSAAEDRETQRISLGIWAVVAVLVFLLLAALF